MKAFKGIEMWKNVSLILLVIIGLSFHEIYKATGITALGIISPVNESKWEHWKMAFYPMLLIGALQYAFMQFRGNNYIFAIAAGVGVFLIITFGGIELYELLLGPSHLPVHVLTFLGGAMAGNFLRHWIMENTIDSKGLNLLGLAFIVILAAILTRFTFDPPRYDYFRDSLTGTYGIHEYK